MLNRISLRERRLIAVAGLIAVLALLLYGVILPIIDGFADRAADRAALLDTYERDERVVAQFASLRRAAELQRRDAAAFRLPGGTAAAAADLFKERIAAAVIAAGADLRGVEDVAAPPGSVLVRADMRLTTAQLTKLLGGLQNEPPLLAVESLTVTADQALQTGRPGPLDVRLEVSGSYPAAAPR